MKIPKTLQNNLSSLEEIKFLNESVHIPHWNNINTLKPSYFHCHFVYENCISYHSTIDSRQKKTSEQSLEDISKLPWAPYQLK